MSLDPTVHLGTKLQQNLRPWHVLPPACQADFLTLKVSSFWGTIKSIMGKILLMSKFPAPYRAELFKLISDDIPSSIYFEKNSDYGRNQNWFILDSNFIILDKKINRKRYRKEIRYINNHDLYVMYEFVSLRAMWLMFRCIIHKKKYIINCDGAILMPSPVKDVIKRFFISHATAYLASGNIAKKYLLYYGAKNENIYLHKFTTLFEKDIKILAVEYKPHKNKYCIAVGRFIALKKYDLLIKTWTKIDKNEKLLIIGGGEERSHYEQLIESFELNNIILINYMPKQELFEYYKGADLFIHPTSYDVWGLVINEAMACGLPVITTDKCVAGLELIENGINGYIVPVGDDVILADRINKVLEDDELRKRMAENNLAKIREYTIENMAKAQCKAFIEILGK